MYKSRFQNIPLLIENPSGKKKSGSLIDWNTVKKGLFLFQFLVKYLLHLLWALMVGLFSFARTIWRENPRLRSMPWARMSFLVLLGWFLLGNSPGISKGFKNPIIKSGLLLPASGEAKKEDVREKDLTPISPELLKNPSVKSFVEQFQQVARDEMKLYGIPASIKMGQAIIESQAGKSVLARQSKNFFGIKCKSKCLGCTCKNYADDNKYDMFRVFDTAWESWRAHSELLCNPRYSKLSLYGKDYKKWAKGLKKAGYATDPSYDKKLIAVIEKYNLTKLDK